MARTRQIKPGFFLNEELASVSPLARLLFAGLWTVADREGRLEDRPNKLRAAVLPYDRADGEKLIAQLADRGFVTRYAVGGKRYLQIVNFAQHQKPHPKEQPSEIPAPCESESRVITGTSNGKGTPLRDEIGTSSALPSESASPSESALPSGSPSVIEHTQTRARAIPKRLTVVDAEFRAEMVSRYTAQAPADRVNEEIDAALGHQAATKYHDLRAYVRKWLSRSDWSPPQKRYAGRGADKQTYSAVNGHDDVWDALVNRE